MDSDLLRSRVTGTVEFQWADEWGLHYKTNDGWRFTVHLEDMMGGKFGRIERGASLMKWIRKAMEQEERDDSETDGG